MNLLIVFMVLVSLSGFRYRIGGDSYFYIKMYEYLPTLPELSSIELGVSKLQPLWLLLNAISRTISPDFFVFQLLHALIVNSIIFYFFRKYTKYVFTAVLLYFIGFYGYFNFEILRESLAICVFLLSLEFFVKKKWLRYYVLVFVAFGFHYSAILLFILPLLKRIPINFFSILIIIVIGAFLNTFFLSFINSLSGNNGFFMSLENYGDYNYTIWGLVGIIVLYVLYPFIVMNASTNFLNIKNSLYPFLRFFILIGAFCSLFYIFFRFRNYFTPIFFVFLTEVVHSIFRNKKIKEFRKIISFLILFFFAFMHSYKYFSDTSEKVDSSRWYSLWYPYNSIFDKDTDPTRERLFNEL
ncbi:EpsG family protein [Draconibacterium orientale]